MGAFTPYIFIAVFGGGIAVDIIGHKTRNLYRTKADRIFLAVLIVLLGISVAVTFASRRSGRTDDRPGTYIAYRYLLENSPGSALYIVSEDGDMDDSAKKIITILAEAELGDNESLYFDSCEYLDEKGNDAGQMHIVQQLKDIAVDVLNKKPRSGAEISYLVRSSYAQMNIEETDTLKSLFETDKSIRSGGAEALADSSVTSLLNELPQYDIVNKIAISYYLTIGDFDSASDISRQLLDRNKTEANYVLYTDVLAQEAYSQETEKLAEGADDEIRPLVEDALSHYEAAISANGNDIGSIETNAWEAEKSYNEARGVYYQRLINFLELKKNQGIGKDGIIDLQLIKLKILKGDHDSAFRETEALLDRIEALDTSSPIREDLIRVRQTLDIIRENGLGSESAEFMELCNAVSDLLDNASCMIFTYGEDNINNNAYKVMAAMIYRGLPGLKISFADTSKYPKTEIDFSLTIRKKNIIGGPGEFYADDFTFTDQGEQVKDCKVTARNGYSGRSCALVLDLQSAEITEEDSDELKNALYDLTDESRAAEKYALVNSTSYIQSELTDDSTQFRYAVRNINTQYAVSAYTCLNTAMDLLEKTGKEEDRTIIYVTNGTTLSEEELPAIVNRALTGNIRIYALSAGIIADERTGTLCSATGGVKMAVPYYDQMGVFIRRLSEYMNYRYTASFTASADTGTSSGREFVIELNDADISDKIVYMGGGS